MIRWPQLVDAGALGLLAWIAVAVTIPLMTSDAPQGEGGVARAQQASPVLLPSPAVRPTVPAPDLSGRADVAVEEGFPDSYAATATPLVSTGSRQVEREAALLAARIVIEPEEDRYYDADQFFAALGRSPFPVTEWPTVWTIFQGCEATADSPRLFGDDVPRVDAGAVGDDGLARGAGQVRIDAHPALARSLDLFDLDDNLMASYIIWVMAGESYSPWSCSEEP